MSKAITTTGETTPEKAVLKLPLSEGEQALPFWVDFFEDLFKVRGRSRNTVLSYRRDLELYAQFLATKKPIPQLYTFMKKRGLSSRSQARMISSVRTYLRFLQSRGEPVEDILEALYSIYVPLPPPPALTADEFAALHKASQTRDKKRSVRNHITLSLLLNLGCRVTELISLNVEDYHLNAGIHIRGRGVKDRLLPLSTELHKDLQGYLTHVREEILVESTTSLLINDRGNRPSRVDIWRWLVAWSGKAGFQKPVHPHRFRHGCAKALVRAGEDLPEIKKILGHASLQSTQIYA